MTSKFATFATVLCLMAALSMNAVAAKKHPGQRLAVGTISSISGDQLVVNEKLKGKEEPVIFTLDSSTQKSGNLANGSFVTIQYRTENNQNIASSVRERAADPSAKKASKKS